MTAKKWNRFHDLKMLGGWGRGGEACFSCGASQFDFYTPVIGSCPSLASDVRNTDNNTLKNIL
jgi:hypothetical protein